MAQGLKERIRQIFVSQYSELLSQDQVDEAEIRQIIAKTIENILGRPRGSLAEEEKNKIISELVDEFAGLGPIENLMKDPEITEIMINGPGRIYIEKQGKKEVSDIVFEDEQQLRCLIYKILAPTRRRVDESYPFTDVSLKDGSRVNIIILPLSLDGSTITIRKFLKELKAIEDLIRLGALDRRMADFLVACIKAKVNIIFSGATGAGKTTTLNVLTSYIPNEERIVTIEDTAELHLNQDHVVRLEARQPNIEGKGEVTIRDLFKNTLRMRPNRIILGEIRSGEALDMLQAICSGHAGSLSVIHADSPEDVIYRLETMILVSGVAISLDAIHRQTAAAINLIVQQEQLVDGSRKITNIAQVNGLKDGRVHIEDIFVYEMEGVNANGVVQGRWRATGIVPVFHSIFKKLNIPLPRDIFNKD